MLEYMSEEDLSIFTQKDFDYMVEHIDEDGVQTDEKYVIQLTKTVNLSLMSTLPKRKCWKMLMW